MVAPSGDQRGVVSRDATQDEVWTIPAAGGTATRVTRGNVAAATVRWAPDSRTLFFTGATAGGARPLFRVPAAGGTPRPLTRVDGGATIDASFELSPDGAHVAYGYLVSGWGFLEVVPSGGGTPRRFAAESVRIYQLGPQWSPDGSRIAANDWNFETNLSNLMVVSVSDGTTRRLPAAADVHEFAPRWMPDGRSLVSGSAMSKVRFVTADLSRLLAGATP